MERILKKNNNNKNIKDCEVDLAKNPQCLLCLKLEVDNSMETLKTLTKSDLIKIIQNKNDLLINYANWIETLEKRERERI